MRESVVKKLIGVKLKDIIKHTGKYFKTRNGTKQPLKTDN